MAGHLDLDTLPRRLHRSHRAAAGAGGEGLILLGVCRSLRAVCHADATGVTLTRPFEGEERDGA